jgi:hyperosmotically inducible periplasmic protein
MDLRATFAIIFTSLALLFTAGCAVTRDQQTVGAYVDDAAITTTVKTRFVENKAVDAAAISVETLNGTVMLSGFAKNANEKSTAETIARGVKGVKAVKNEIAVRP